MTSDETKLEDDSPEEEERTRLEGSDPNETALEGGVGKRSEGFGSVGQSFEGTEKSYLVLEELEASGAEADVYVVEEQGSDDRRVLKYYRRGIRPKAEITEMLAGLDKEHVVQVYETGVKDGRSYEIQEFVEHGSLADMVTSDGLPDARMKEILRELLTAVEYIHKLKPSIIHRDLKPANVLVRARKPLDLLLADFGIASPVQQSLHFTGREGTLKYSSPEAMEGIVSKDSDWWSVGVILMELLTGLHPFAGLDHTAIIFQLVTRGIPVSEKISDEWELLFKGLHTKDTQKRWGAKQVRKWLEGDRSIPVGASEEKKRQYDYKPYKFAGKPFYEPTELAIALGKNWEDGVKHFGRGYPCRWVEDDLRDFDVASKLMDVAEDETLNPSQKLSVAIMILNPKLPLLDQGGVVTNESLRKGTAAALDEIFDSGLGGWLIHLKEQNWLTDLGREFRRIQEAVAKFSDLVDSSRSRHFSLFADSEIDECFDEFLLEYGPGENRSVGKLFKLKRLGKEHKIALLSTRLELLKTREQLRREELQEQIPKTYWPFLNNRLLFEYDMFSDEELSKLQDVFKKKYAGCTDGRVNHLFNLKEYSRLSRMQLISINRKYLKNHEEVRKELVTEKLSEHWDDLDQETAFALDKLSDEELAAKFTELQKKYGGCENSELNAVFVETGNPSRWTLIALLSLDEKYLKNHEEVRKELVTETLREYWDDLDSSDDLDLEKAYELDLLAEKELGFKWSGLLAEYGGCKVSPLNQSFKAENPTRIDKIALLSLRRELLKTNEQIRQETLRSSLGDYLEHVDEQTAFELDLLDEEALDSKWEKLRGEYGGCKVSRLNQSFKAKNPMRIDKIAILSLRRELLKTHEEVREETLRSSLGDCLKHVDEQKVFALDLLDEEELDSKWEKLRREYVGCGVPYLYQSFKAENPPRIDKLVILSLHRKLLFTQGEISIEGKGFTISGFSLEMLWCPSGTFEMGSPKGIFSGESGRQSNEVQHEVTLTQGFWLGKYPVTQTQWKAVMGSEFPLGGANPSNHKGADRPVEQVSWIDVTAFCEKLTGLESNAGRLPAGMSYQLPTEAQWEYACRAGTNTAYAFGDSLTEEQANISGGPEETTSVGSYKPNAWGFYDMHGNVWEWCEDWHGPYQSSPAHDPVGPKGSNTRITRGGAWNIHGWGARSANRSWDLPWVTRDCLGFRLSLGLKPTER